MEYSPSTEANVSAVVVRFTVTMYEGLEFLTERYQCCSAQAPLLSFCRLKNRFMRLPTQLYLICFCTFCCLKWFSISLEAAYLIPIFTGDHALSRISTIIKCTYAISEKEINLRFCTRIRPYESNEDKIMYLVLNIATSHTQQSIPLTKSFFSHFKLCRITIAYWKLSMGPSVKSLRWTGKAG